MDLSKFTERARGFVQNAQSIAVREDHQRLEPLHLLKALVDDSEGFAANLIASSGGDAAQLTELVDQAFSKLPKVSGGSHQMILETSTAKVLSEAEKLAEKAKDQFVTVERILTALAVVRSSAKDLLTAAKVSAQNLNFAINDLRKGRGPTKLNRLASQRAAKVAFSERKPQPGWMAVARVRVAAARMASASR